MPTLTPDTTPFYGGGQVVNPANVIKTTGAPGTANIKQKLGTLAIDNAAGLAYILVSKSGGTATWTLLEGSGGSGVFSSLAVTGTSTLTGATNINITGAALTKIGVGGTGAVQIGNTTGNTSVTGSLNTTTTLTAGTGLTVTTGGILVSGGDIINSHSSAGIDVTIEATNSDNTNGASRSGVEIATGGASSGDPYLSFQISGVGASTMTMGLDNSDSDKLKISNSTALGTNDALTLTQAGALNATTSISAGTSLTATLGDITATDGNLVLGTLGKKIVIPTGADASAGTSGVMSGTPGVVTVSTTACSATAKVFYCRNVTGGTPGEVSITAQDGTGFTLTSTANETSTFNWWIINA